MKNKVKFPSVIKIGYQSVTVDVVPTQELPKASSGQYRDNGKIFIEEETSPVESVNVLIHEVLHAIWNTYGMKEVIDDKHEEYAANTFANGLTQVLRDNPVFMDWIRANLK